MTKSQKMNSQQKIMPPRCLLVPLFVVSRVAGFNSKEKKCVYYPCDRTKITVVETGWRHYFPPNVLGIDCHDLRVKGQSVSAGIYKIYPPGNNMSVDVYCKMDENGGLWTVIQKRMSGSVSFDKSWEEYRKGFGNPEDSYWIGNDVIHRLTKGRNSSLYVSITLQSGTTLYELYHQFSVSDEANKYKLSLGGPVTGTLGDRMLLTGYSDDFASGMYFSTQDRDNDRAGYHCAANWRGGWWFNSCHSTYLNGLWSSENWVSPWYPTVQYGTEIKETLMMIKPH